MDATKRTIEPLVLKLSEATLSDADRIGNKAANLAALIQTGFPVPDGIIVTTDGFRRFLAENQLGAESTPRAIGSAPLPPDVVAALSKALKAFAGAPLAVRSSAQAEDLPGASFAGQYETVLDVTGLDGVAQAVRRCWASASADRLRAYREVHRLEAAPMAVLIQKMIDAHAAGVAFSSNPVTGHRGQVLVNAVRGLGERLVSGEASPDVWRVTGGEAICDASPEDAIDGDQALAIAGLARRAETHFGTPQDIEWAVDRDGRLHLLQARPITSLPEPPVEPIPIDFEVPPGYWQHDASHSPRASYPIDRFIFPLIRATSQRWAEEFGYLIDGIEFREIGLRPYLRMVPLAGEETARTPPRWVMWLLARTLPTLRRRLSRAAEAVRSDKAGRYIARWYETWQPELSRALSRHLVVDLARLSDGELERHLDSARDLLERGIEIHSLLTGSLAMVMYDLATTCEELLGWELARVTELVSGTSYKSTEPARRLRELAGMADANPAVRELLARPSDRTIERLASVDEAFAAEFHTYLRDYGCRALGYNVAEPTLAENPVLFLQLVRGQLEAGYDPEANHATTAAIRERSAAEARRALSAAPRKEERFERALDRALRAYPVREDNEFFTLSAPLATMRYAILEAGRRLADRGVIRERDDVRFLELEQALTALADGGGLSDLIEHRKGQRAWAELHPGPPSYGEAPPGPPSLDFLPADARLPMEALMWSFEAMMAMGVDTDETSEATLRGIPASAGRYTGPVRVVVDETQFSKLQAGDVLVCPVTSPVWSVLFSTIGALVTDTGGVLSHPAIIAREYRIPAVVATGTATTRFNDGRLVTVDGAAGTVTEVV